MKGPVSAWMITALFGWMTSSAVADINALTAAAESGDVAAVTKILGEGVNVSARDAKGWFPLSKAASGGQVEVMELLVKHGANVNEETANRNTPLIFAAQKGHVDAVKWLLAKGANVNTKSRNGYTARMLAERQGFREVADLLAKMEAMPVEGLITVPPKLEKLPPLFR